jgi:hypothetical protein
MENKKARFLKAYADIPEPLRNEIIAVLDGKTYTWNSIYFEVKSDTSLGEKLLNTLTEIKII